MLTQISGNTFQSVAGTLCTHTAGVAGNCPACSPTPTDEQKIRKGEAYDIYEAQTSFLLGKVLTVVDASYADREQRKAVKDLIRQQFREQSKWVAGILTGRNLLVTTDEDMKPV